MDIIHATVISVISDYCHRGSVIGKILGLIAASFVYYSISHVID